MTTLTRNWMKKSVRDIFRQKLLFFALIMLFFLGIGSYIALTMGYTNLEATYLSFYNKTSFADVELFTHEDVWFNLSQVQEEVAKFKTLHQEIESVNFRLLVKVGHQLSSDREGVERNYYNEGRLIGLNWTISNQINDLFFESGYFENKTTMNSSLLIEAHYAHHFELKVGDSHSTQIFGQLYNFTIQGIVFSPEYLLVIPSRYDFLPTHRFGVGFLPLEYLQMYTNLTGLANNIIVKMQDNVPQNTRNQVIAELASSLNRVTNNSFTLPVFQEFQISNWALKLDLDEIKEIALILPVVVLGVAGVSIYITLGRIIQSQRRSIGIAASLGYLPNDILGHYFLLILLIGTVGSIAGILVGIGVSGVVTWVYAYYMGFPTLVKIVPQLPVILIGGIIGITVSLVGGIIPAFKASRMLPREALQTTMAIEHGKRSILEKVLVFNPLRLKLTIPLRNLTRRRLRTIATVLGLASSVMILVVALAFIDSVGAGIYRQFYQTSQYDIIIKYNGFKFADLGVKEDIAAIKDLDPAVLGVEPVLQIPSIIHIGNTQQEVLITAFNTTQPIVHTFQWTGAQDQLINDSLVICSAIANRYSLSQGSNISFEYPQIPGIDFAFEAASWLYNRSSVWGPEFARNNTMQFLDDILSESKERLSFSDVKNIRFLPTNVSVSGVSEEIWGGFIYTHIGLLTSLMGLDIFKTSFLDIDLTPYSQLIVKVEDPGNITHLEGIRDLFLTELDDVRSIEFFYDYRLAVDIMMGAFNAVVGVFLVFACVLAGASVFTAIFINFQERKREIATMFSLGLSDREFLLMMTLENIILSFLGLVVGIPLGIWMSSWLLDNILRVFYFQLFIQSQTWLLLWSGVFFIVLVSQLPAIRYSIHMDLTEVTKELTS